MKYPTVNYFTYLRSLKAYDPFNYLRYNTREDRTLREGDSVIITHYSEMRGQLMLSFATVEKIGKDWVTVNNMGLSMRIPDSSVLFIVDKPSKMHRF